MTVGDHRRFRVAGGISRNSFGIGGMGTDGLDCMRCYKNAGSYITPQVTLIISVPGRKVGTGKFYRNFPKVLEIIPAFVSNQLQRAPVYMKGTNKIGRSSGSE